MLPHFDVFEKKEKNMEKLRKGLKKGEYFEDGGRIFVIDEVLEDGVYISHMETPKEGMTAAEMKEKLKSLGLPTSGSKAELAERLAAAETEEETEKGSKEKTETEEESEEE